MDKPTLQVIGKTANSWNLAYINGNEMRSLNHAENDEAVGGVNFKEQKPGRLQNKTLAVEPGPDSHFIMMHEAIETLGMDGYGWGYEKAHKVANSFEKIIRNMYLDNIKKYGSKTTLEDIGKGN